MLSPLLIKVIYCACTKSPHEDWICILWQLSPRKMNSVQNILTNNLAIVCLFWSIDKSITLVSRVRVACGIPCMCRCSTFTGNPPIPLPYSANLPCCVFQPCDVSLTVSHIFRTVHQQFLRNSPVSPYPVRAQTRAIHIQSTNPDPLYFSDTCTDSDPREQDKRTRHYSVAIIRSIFFRLTQAPKLLPVNTQTPSKTIALLTTAVVSPR